MLIIVIAYGIHAPAKGSLSMRRIDIIAYIILFVFLLAPGMATAVAPEAPQGEQLILE